MHVIIPVKSFARAKSRLGPLFDGAMRRELAGAMARSVLIELGRVKALGRVLVVTSEPEMMTTAPSLGAEAVWDGGSGGLNGALALAEEGLAPSRAGIAVVCADLPLFRAAEFEKMRAAHRALGREGVTVAADRAGTGTNVRMVTATDRFPYLYGPQSARLHWLAARSRGLPHGLFASPTLALDLDSPPDALQVLQARRSHDRHALAVSTILSTRLGQLTGDLHP